MTVDELEARVKKLEIEVKRSEAVLEIMKVQSRYNYYLELGFTDRIFSELFAQKDPNIKCEVVNLFEGHDAVHNMWKAMGGVVAPRGFLGTVMISTPHIQVNKDATQAKAMWHGFGPNTVNATPYPCDGEHQDVMTAVWIMLKYNNEYELEDGKWKIKSLQLVPIIQCTYEEGWLKQANPRRVIFPPNSGAKESTLYNPYEPCAYNELLPPPPDPFD